MLQRRRLLIKSLKYSSNLHKNLGARHPWVFFFFSLVLQCGGLYFSLWLRPHSSEQFVFQTLILHALRTAAIFPKETPTGVYLGHKYKRWDCVQPLQNLKSCCKGENALLFIVRPCVCVCSQLKREDVLFFV